MIKHTDLGDHIFTISRKLKQLIDEGKISYGGNQKLKIYGKLNCRSGKRMKATNRVFFASENEAVQAGYQPCGHCMKEQYGIWKVAAK